MMTNADNEMSVALVEDAAADTSPPDPQHPQFWKGLNTGISMCAESARRIADELDKDGISEAAAAMKIYAKSLIEDQKPKH